MYSLEESLTYWNDAGRYGSVEERLARAELWLPYYSFIANKLAHTQYHGNAQASRTVDYMLRESIINKNDTVLDIGAGMGGYSIELARCCASVTALDINGDCLNILKERAAQYSLSNISCINSAWENYKDSKQFDVTFSAMCPAICDQQELLRLESITKRTACLLTVTRGSFEKCRMELMRQFPLKKQGGMVSEALHYYNVLYLMGRQPCIQCWSEHTNSSASVDSLIEQYAIYLKIFGIEESQSIPFMRDFFDKKAINGVIEDEGQMNYALVYWNVPIDEKGQK